MARPSAVGELRLAVERSVDACASAGLAGRRMAVLVRGVRWKLEGVVPRIPLSSGPGWTLSPLENHERGCLLVAEGRRGGHDRSHVLLPIRTLVRLGVGAVLLLDDAEPLTRAAASAQMVLVSDHVNLESSNPLVGANDDSFGPRFPDMSTAYDELLRDRICHAVPETGVGVVGTVPRQELIPDGDDVAIWGEYGITSVTTGVAPFVIAARHAGMRVAAVVAHAAVARDQIQRLIDASLSAV